MSEQLELEPFKIPRLFDWDVTIAPSILQSTIQKAVRRQRPDLAVRAVASMWSQGKESRTKLVRRLPIIVLEDAVLTENYHELVEVMKVASRKGYIENEIDLWLLLDTAARIARTEWCDGGGWDKSGLSAAEIGEEQRLECGRERSLVSAMFLRGKFGGMSGDVDRQYHMSLVWTKRFLEGTGWELVFKAYREVEGYVGMIENLSPIDVGDLIEFPYGVDQHCSGVTRILWKKAHVQAMFGNYEELADLIWNRDSGLSLKNVLQTGEPHVYENVTPYDEAIWQQIEPEYCRVQHWWIENRV